MRSTMRGRGIRNGYIKVRSLRIGKVNSQKLLPALYFCVIGLQNALAVTMHGLSLQIAHSSLAVILLFW